MAEANAELTGASPVQPVRQWEQVDLLGAFGGGADDTAPPSPASPIPASPSPDSQIPAPPSPAPPSAAPLPAAPVAAAPLAGAQPTVPTLSASGSASATAAAPAQAPHSLQAGPAPIPPLASPAPAAPEPSAFASPGATVQQPTRLLILDTETTGLSPADSSCIEVGAVLFSVPQRAVLMQVSFLLPCDANPAAAINRIDAATTRLPQPWQAGLACFQAMVEDCDLVVAHNAAFDRQWFGHGPLPELPRPWICSMEDIRWPSERQLRSTPSVRDLALAYEIPVWAAHRALTDCIYLAQVFARCDDLEALLAAALEPRRLYRACLSYEERHRAREAGFRWNDPVPRAWSRRLSEREATALPFPVEAVAA